MNELAFNLEYFLQFEVTNLLKLIKIGFYAFFTIFFFCRMHIRKKNDDPYSFEILVALFFLLMCIGSAWEVFCLVIDPIFLHNGMYYYYELNFLPTGFNGMALVFFLGYIGLGFLSLAAERGSNLPTKGFISIIPFSFPVLLLVWGIPAIVMPWFLFTFIAAIVPLLFIYLAIKAEGAIRNKAIFHAIGFLGIFASEALNMNLWSLNLPEVVGYIWHGIFGFPIHFVMPLGSVMGCAFLLLGQIIYRD